MQFKFRRERSEPTPRVFVLCDLDDTLVLTREHWQKASFSAIRSMVAHGLKITAPESVEFMREWKNSEEGRSAIHEMRNTHGEMRNDEAFLYPHRLFRRCFGFLKRFLLGSKFDKIGMNSQDFHKFWEACCPLKILGKCF